MKHIDEIRAGVTSFFDAEIRPALPAMKGVAYGMMIGAAMAKPQAWLSKIMPGAQAIAMMDGEGNVEIEILAQLLRDQIKASGGKIQFEIGINPMNPADKDRFVFTAADIDKLLEHIDRY